MTSPTSVSCVSWTATAGIRDAVPIIAGYFTVAFVFGLMAVIHGLPVWVPVAMSTLVYAGASQFSFLALYAAMAPISTIVATTMLINLRHMLMSLYMSTALQKHGFSKPSRWLYAVGLTDESFAFHSATFERASPTTAYLVTFNASCHVSWIMGTFAGALTSLYSPWALTVKLDYALTAMMLYVLASLIGTPVKLRVAAASIAAMCVLNLISKSHFNVFAATAAGCMVGIWTKRNSR